MYRKTHNLKYYSVLLITLVVSLGSCKKLVQIDPPAASITTAEVFKDSTNSSAAILDLYSKMINTRGQQYLFSGGVTIYAGLSSDEFQGLLNDDENQLYTNQLLSSNSVIEGYLFTPAYQEIYRANACIEGVNASTGISASLKKQFTGEAKFIRALTYFYLVNLFGDVPYITSIDYHQSSIASRTSKDQIYLGIIADLKDAQALPSDYSISGGERIRINKWAATALLARVYLYQKDYVNAISSATSVINNATLFSLNPDLNSVFLKNNSEAIFQLKMNNGFPPYNATPEGYQIIPDAPDDFSRYYLSPQLLNAFETGDQRKNAWIDTTNYSGTLYYFAYKYKVGPANAHAGDESEYYMVLRLAEQYLIRAEAEANGAGDGTSGAVVDLDAIRRRAGLSDYTGATDKTSLLNAVMHERQIELFAEWGNRWMDLKRTGQIDAVMSVVTPTKTGGAVWKSYQQLYPIPQAEILRDPNLKQNPGY